MSKFINPGANALSSSVDEAKLLEAIRISGYPLQVQVAKTLQASGFEVFEEWGYSDRNTQEYRSLDIYAYTQLESGDGTPNSRLHLLVECKRSELPYVFFEPGVSTDASDFPLVVGLSGLQLKIDERSHQDASPATFFRADELPFVAEGPPMARSFARPERKGKLFELSGEVPFNKIIFPLVSSIEQFRQMFSSGVQAPLIVLAVCALDAPMMYATGTPENPTLSYMPCVRVVHQETLKNIHHWHWRHYTVDFVHRAFMPTYLEQHAIPFAKALVARFAAHRRVVSAVGRMRPKALSWAHFIDSDGKS